MLHFARENTLGPIRGTMVGQQYDTRIAFAVNNVHMNHMSSFVAANIDGEKVCVSICLSHKASLDIYSGACNVCVCLFAVL